jgi:hypothetical protein
MDVGEIFASADGIIWIIKAESNGSAESACAKGVSEAPMPRQAVNIIRQPRVTNLLMGLFCVSLYLKILADL